MIFTLLVGLSALFVAGCAAYFSVIGIATLFSGHYMQVLIMAGALEFGKIIATSYLYRYWNKTALFLKAYLLTAVLVLMFITSLGIFGYLSSGYQTNRGKTEMIDGKTALVEQQKTTLQTEIEQINQRINTLNEARKAQEKRLPQLSRTAAKPIYSDIERAGEEIKSLNSRAQTLQTALFEKDSELIELKGQIYELHDIGTFKFVAESFNVPLDTIVKLFILIIVLVFDPLAVALILAYNTAAYGKMLKEKPDTKRKKEFTETPAVTLTPTETPTLSPTPSETCTFTPTLYDS